MVESMTLESNQSPRGMCCRHFRRTGSRRRVSGTQGPNPLIVEARQTPDLKKRLEWYREVETIVNDEFPMRYTHHLTLLEAGAMTIRDDQLAISGSPSTKGAGLRVARMA